MAVLHTQRIDICGMKSSRKQILEELQRTGSIQVIQEGEEDETFRRMDTAQARSRFERRAKNAADALAVLDTYAPEKTGLLSSLNGKQAIPESEYEKQVARKREVRGAGDRILELQRRIGESRAGRIRAESALVSLEPWMDLDVPMNFRGSRTTAAFIGTLPGHWTQETVVPAIAQAHPELTAYSVELIGAGQEQSEGTCIFAVCPKKDAEAFEDALRVCGFVRPTLKTEGTPKEYAEQLKEEGRQAAAQEEKAIAEIREMGHWRRDLEFLEDYYRMRAEKYRVLCGLLQSEHVFFVSGYVPEYCADKVKERLERKYDCAVTLSAPSQEENAPVLLHNNAFSAPTESVVESFGLPNQGEPDPTGIMAFFYYFLFGLMLSDAGYGILMVIACGYCLKKFKNMEKGLQSMLKMFFYSGISTAVWGALFGGWFGDVVTVFSETFLGRTITIPALWFVPLDEPMKLLLFSFLFGLIHLFVGLGVKGYMLLRDRKYLDFFSTVLCWYILILALILMLLPSDIFASMSGTVFTFPAWVGVFAKWAAIVSAVGIVLFSESGTKNPAIRIALGAYDLYGISSWLSDVLSYSRLLALGLATGVIASVINTMAGMLGSATAGIPGGTIIGILLFAVVFVIGHILNMAINLLGAYVHTNRLQFVEFFGKFYEGGGRPFRPFSAASNHYFKFEEEN